MIASRIVRAAGEVYTQPKAPTRRKLFKQLVDVVSIETHSYCNRKCWFCPNSFIDRQSFCHYLPKSVYRQILEDLAEINYSQVISFARYMEPFADAAIYERIAEARKIVPLAHIRANTNGDYVTPTTLKLMEAAGLNRVAIQLYPPGPATPFDDAHILPLAERKQKQLGIPFQKLRHDADWLEWSGRQGKMLVEMRARNFRVNGENRGGLKVSKEYVRKLPCHSAFNTVCVHHSQEMIGCCHLRSDHPDHKIAILGTVGENRGDLFDVYTSEHAAFWRGLVLNHGGKPEACMNCAAGIPVDKR